MNNKSKSIIKQKSAPLIKIIFFSLIFGIAIGYVISYLTISRNNTEKVKPVQEQQEYSQERAGGYLFTNPLLDCGNFNHSELKSHVQLINLLNTYVDNTIKNGEVEHISVYFRSLNEGPWIGINENYYYAPASLLKVPIMIALLKKAETDPSLLKKELPYTAHIDSAFVPGFEDAERLKIGNKYTVEQLLEYMIIYSDNDAKVMLFKLVGEDFVMNVMSDCGVNLKNRDLNIDFLTVKEYSSFYRILYNASYLNREMSEKALELLSRSEFNDGIPKNLPKDIKVSHKFGERGYLNSNL